MSAKVSTPEQYADAWLPLLVNEPDSARVRRYLTDAFRAVLADAALASAPSAAIPAPAAAATRDDIAAYLLDRADQYNLKSPCWVALSDMAENIARGDAEAAAAHGELDAGLYARVKRMSGRSPGAAQATATTPTKGDAAEALATTHPEGVAPAGDGGAR